MIFILHENNILARSIKSSYPTSSLFILSATLFPEKPPTLPAAALRSMLDLVTMDGMDYLFLLYCFSFLFNSSL